MRAIFLGVILGVSMSSTTMAFANELSDQANHLKAGVPVVVCVNSTVKVEELMTRMNAKISDLTGATTDDRVKNEKHLKVSAPSVSITPTEYAVCVTLSLE